jgi:hypothetical protein
VCGLAADLADFVQQVLKLTATWTSREYTLTPLMDICLTVESRRPNKTAKVIALPSYAQRASLSHTQRH